MNLKMCIVYAYVCLVCFFCCFFISGKKEKKIGHTNRSNKMMSAGMLEPPLASHPEHTGKVSVKKKVGSSWISSHPLASVGANQAHTLSHWLNAFAFIVPSRQAAAV